jgi:hypothetical protein
MVVKFGYKPTTTRGAIQGKEPKVETSPIWILLNSGMKGVNAMKLYFFSYLGIYVTRSTHGGSKIWIWQSVSDPISL